LNKAEFFALEGVTLDSDRVSSLETFDSFGFGRNTVVGIEAGIHRAELPARSDRLSGDGGGSTTYSSDSARSISRIFSLAANRHVVLADLAASGMCRFCGLKKS